MLSSNNNIRLGGTGTGTGSGTIITAAVAANNQDKSIAFSTSKHILAVTVFSIVLLIAVPLRGATAFQFQYQQQRQYDAYHARRVGFIPISNNIILNANHHHPMTTTSLKVLPVTASVAVVATNVNTNAAAGIVGTALDTIGRILFPQTASVTSKVVRATALLFTTLFATSSKFCQRIFWSGYISNSNSDAAVEELQLPPGSLGCPFIGCPFMLGNEKSFGISGSDLFTEPPRRKWVRILLEQPRAFSCCGKWMILLRSRK